MLDSLKLFWCVKGPHCFKEYVFYIQNRLFKYQLPIPIYQIRLKFIILKLWKSLSNNFKTINILFIQTFI